MRVVDGQRPATMNPVHAVPRPSDGRQVTASYVLGKSTAAFHSVFRLFYVGLVIVIPFKVSDPSLSYSVDQYTDLQLIVFASQGFHSPLGREIQQL